jgi:excinuclease ABC subunit A
MEHGTKTVIIVPFKQHAKRDTREELKILMQKGFSRMYIVNRQTVRSEEPRP